MNGTVNIPCVELPKIPDIPGITLLGGAELKGFLDFAAGPPTDCKITFNLLLQLAPLLASMACLLKILKAITALSDAIQDPLKIPDIPAAIGDLAKCIPIPGIDIYLMIKGILELVLRFLSCFIENLESILNFQASIDLSAADDNPVLRATLICAQDSGKASMDNMILSLQPLEPILKMTKSLIGLSQLPIELPDLSNVSASGDMTQTIASLRQAVDQLKQAVESIPG